MLVYADRVNDNLRVANVTQRDRGVFETVFGMLKNMQIFVQGARVSA